MYKSLLTIVAASALLSSCGTNSSKSEVVSLRCVHKYGYDISPEDWEAQKPPGKILTTFRSGKTISEAYEDNLKHGERTVTFEHSQTVQLKEIYRKGILTKQTTYSIRGVPEQEIVYKSPTHQMITTWYAKGTPKSSEEFRDGTLINGQYFSLGNETDSIITNGNGERTIRNTSGDIISKDVYKEYAIAYTETYHPNNTPHVITSYQNGKKHGEVKTFALSGEPIAIENYSHGVKDGICSYYQNGYMYQQTTYNHGKKHGVEKFYIDGDTLAEETEYNNGCKYGPSVVFCDGTAKTTWYFNDEKVSKATFDQYDQRDMMITANK